MRVTLSFVLAAALTAASTLASADWLSTQSVLADLTKANTTLFNKSNVTVNSINTAVTPGVATMTFNGHYASIGQDWTTAHDWSAYNIVHLKMTNPGTSPVDFKFIVQLNADPNNYTGAYTGEFYLPANMTKDFLFYLNVDNPLPYGFKYLNPALSIDTTDIVAGTSFRNLQTVYHWRISYQYTNTAKVQISDLRLMRQSLNFAGIADAFGQYTDRIWPNKVYARTDFSTLLSTENQDIAANPGPGEMQGTTKVANPAPMLGKWAVITLANGEKMLQHPNGKLFWSLGLNSVEDSLPTRIQDRTSYFKSLPSTTGEFASCYSVLNTPAGAKTCFSFRKQNLMMKYGDSYTSPWLSMAKKRLASWGFNTIGIDSSSSLLNSSIPYIIDLSTNGFGTRFRPPVMKWGSLPDPYSSNFVSWCVSAFSSQISANRSNANLMGVFVDNEQSWGNMSSNSMRYNVALGALTAPATQPAKIGFVQQLQTKYSTISALNSAWGTNFSDFNAILNNTTWKPTSYPSSMATDFQSFCATFAYKYYWGINYALRADGLKSFYMGSRFADYTTEVVNSAARNCDILSFNVYDYVSDVPWAYFQSLSKPVLISEFGFGLKGWGTFGGPAPMAVPSGKAFRIQQFLNQAILESNVVGAHYYCYGDQPITGRWSDYENGGFGVVDVTDTPYSDIVNEFRDFTSDMYTVRAGTSGGGGGTTGTTGGTTTGSTTTTGGSTGSTASSSAIGP